jgi:hypothetical protein
MTKHIVFRIVAGLVLLAALAGIAFFAYNAGVMHGAALDVKTITTPAEGQPFPFYGHGMMFHHTFPLFGFGCFGILIPIFLLFLAFAAMRHLLWGPRWGGGWGHHRHGMHGRWGDNEGVPPMFAEWHKRAHGEPPTDEAPKQ